MDPLTLAYFSNIVTWISFAGCPLWPSTHPYCSPVFFFFFPAWGIFSTSQSHKALKCNPDGIFHREINTPPGASYSQWKALVNKCPRILSLEGLPGQSCFKWLSRDLQQQEAPVVHRGKCEPIDNELLVFCLSLPYSCFLQLPPGPCLSLCFSSLTVTPSSAPMLSLI